MSFESVAWITRKKLIRIWPLSERGTDTHLLKICNPSWLKIIEDFYFMILIFFLDQNQYV